MPLVRIEILKGRPTAERKQLLQAVHAALVEAFDIPEDDRTQRLIEHDPENFEIPPGQSRTTPSWRSPPSRAVRQPPSGRSTRRSSATWGRWGSPPATSSSFSANLRWRTGESAAANPLTRSISASGWMSNPPQHQTDQDTGEPDELKGSRPVRRGAVAKVPTLGASVTRRRPTQHQALRDRNARWHPGRSATHGRSLTPRVAGAGNLRDLAAPVPSLTARQPGKQAC